MLKELIFLQSAGYTTDFASLLDSMARLGVFQYILPFLLIFALIYGILLRMKIFEKNAINGVISFSVALISLQYDLVPRFFSEIFPRMGVGLAFLLALIILIGLFAPNQSWVSIVLFIIAAITVITVFVQSSAAYGIHFTQNIGQYGGLIASIIIIIVVIASLTVKPKSPPPKVQIPVLRDVHADLPNI